MITNEQDAINVDNEIKDINEKIAEHQKQIDNLKKIQKPLLDDSWAYWCEYQKEVYLSDAPNHE